MATLGAFMLAGAGLFLPATAAAADDTTTDTAVIADLDGDTIADELDEDADGDGSLKPDDPNDLDATVLPPAPPPAEELPAADPIVEEPPVVEQPVQQAPQPPVEEETDTPSVAPKTVEPTEPEVVDEGTDSKKPRYEWDGKCENAPPALDADAAKIYSEGYERDCWKAPEIDFEVKYCPVVVKVLLSNLKHWLTYEVYINGNKMDITHEKDGMGWVAVTDFEHGKFEVLVKYYKAANGTSDTLTEGKFVGGEVYDKTYVKDKNCDGWEGCERPNGEPTAMSSEAVEEFGKKWEKECWIRPEVDIEVKDWCPTEVKVLLSNLKHWLDYTLYINGEETEIGYVKDGKAWIKVTDFDHGKFKVLLKYNKGWHDESFDKNGEWGHGGKVYEKEYIEKKDCDWNDHCERPDRDAQAFTAESADRFGKDWEKHCYTRPEIDIDVVNWCPTVIDVEITNLKRWLDYKVKVNGEWVDLDIHHGTANIEVTDFESGKFHVLVKYEKKWSHDDKSWDHEKKWGHGGKVYEKEYIKEYDCPVISAEEEKQCNKVDGKAKWEITIADLNEHRKYLVTVTGDDDYKKHFWVEGEHWWSKDLRLHEGHYTVTVESWAHKGGGHGGGDYEGGDDMTLRGGGSYDHADVGPVVSEFDVSGCPVDVAVSPTEDCKSIKAVLDSLVDGREYLIKVKDSEGDVVYEETVWGPTTLDQKFHSGTYKIIVIDVEAKKHGDHNGGWGGWDNGWDNGNHHDEYDSDELETTVVALPFGEEYDGGSWGSDGHGNKDHGDKDHGDRDHGDKDHGDRDHHKKGKGLKWTATITLSDCPTPPPVVHPAGETPDTPAPSVGSSGGSTGGTPTVVGTLATTGADPAGLALAALILLPVGGAALATSAVIARRKNAA